MIKVPAVPGEAHVWYHTIEFPDGTTSPGWYDTRSVPQHVPWPPGVAGSRCLDVGTFDGFWAFRLERMGAAEVVAIDVADPAKLDWPYDRRRRGPELIREWGSARGPGFVEAAARLDSKVRWMDRSVYDLDPDVDGEFDVVLCGALLLHLRDPVLALERMRSVCRGHLVLVEALDPALDLLCRWIPAARLGPEPDQWWRLNSAGLYRLLRVSGWDVRKVGRRFLQPMGPAGPPAEGRKPLARLAAGKPHEHGSLGRAFLATPRQPDDAGP